MLSYTMLLTQAVENPSYVWKSIYGTRKLLEDGIGWRVGSGTQISIWRDEWLPWWAVFLLLRKLQPFGVFPYPEELMSIRLFGGVRILCPERVSNSNQWPDYSGRHTREQRNLQKNLWQLQIPPKIKIANWGILDNYVLTAYILDKKGWWPPRYVLDVAVSLKYWCMSSQGVALQSYSDHSLGNLACSKQAGHGRQATNSSRYQNHSG